MGDVVSFVHRGVQAKVIIFYVGGNGGVKRRPGNILLENLQKEQVLPAVDAVISYYKENGKPQERLGRLIERIGIEGLHEYVEKINH